VRFRTTHCLGALLLFFFSMPLVVRAQAPGDPPAANLPGRHTVSGTVFSPEGVSANRGIQIRLSKGMNDFLAWTDQDGKFLIVGVGNGTYTLSVMAGDEFEPLRERLEIALPRNAPVQIFNFDMRLRRRFEVKPRPGVIDAAMASVPKKAEQHYRDALAAIAKGNPQGGISELLLAVAEYPDFTNAHTELGTQYQKLNQFENSEKHLRIALKLKPNSYAPLASLGVALVRLGKHAEAETSLRDALKIKDDSAIVRFYLGRSLLSQKRIDEAEGEFRAAINIGGKDMVEARRSLANIYLQRGEEKKALDEIEAYLAADTKPADEKKLRDTAQQLKDRLKESQKP